MKLCRVKWENIILLILGFIFGYSIILHIIKNGFEMTAVGFEIIVYSILLGMTYLCAYYLRQEIIEKEK